MHSIVGLTKAQIEKCHRQAESEWLKTGVHYDEAFNRAVKKVHYQRLLRMFQSVLKRRKK